MNLMPTPDNPSTDPRLDHHRPDLRHRPLHRARTREARHRRAGRPQPGQARRGRAEIRQQGGHAVSVLCDFSDIDQRPARGRARSSPSSLPIAGLLNNAGHHADHAGRERAGLGPHLRDQPPRPVRVHRGAGPPPARRRERRVHLLRRRGSRAQARGHRRLPRRPLHLRRGQRARRMGTRRLRTSGRRCLRHLEAVQPRHCPRVRAGDPAAAVQRRRAGLQPGHRLGRDANVASGSC